MPGGGRRLFFCLTAVGCRTIGNRRTPNDLQKESPGFREEVGADFSGLCLVTGTILGEFLYYFVYEGEILPFSKDDMVQQRETKDGAGLSYLVGFFDVML